jgi:hypothetical protein
MDCHRIKTSCASIFEQTAIKATLLEEPQIQQTSHSSDTMNTTSRLLSVQYPISDHAIKAYNENVGISVYPLFYSLTTDAHVLGAHSPSRRRA